MKILCLFAAILFCSISAIPDADAARFGGGRSFGGRSTYSRPAQIPQQPAGQAFSRQQTQKQSLNQGANPGMAQRSGFGGMLGGLLAGTLLGSLLFGGAHVGFGMMDILLAALVAFLGLKLLGAVMARREAAPEAAGHSRSAGEGSAPSHDPWQGMRSSLPGSETGAVNDVREGAPEAFPAEGAVPPGFDREDFLRGAKVLFARLQDSWDRRDIADIATFATPAIVREVEEQAKADPGPSATEVLLVNASLVSVTREGDDDVATVFFDVLIRENPEAGTPAQVRELWHFLRPAGSTVSWRLDGIQQVS